MSDMANDSIVFFWRRHSYNVLRESPLYATKTVTDNLNFIFNSSISIFNSVDFNIDLRANIVALYFPNSQ